MKNANMSGLKRRQTYEEMINYLHYGQEVVKYPDRRAKQLRESPYMTQLDGEDLDDQHERLLIQQRRQLAVQQVSAQTGRSAAEQTIQQGGRINRENPQPITTTTLPPEDFYEPEEPDEGGPGDDSRVRQDTGFEVATTNPVRNARAVQEQWRDDAMEGTVSLRNQWRVQDTARVAQVIGKFGMAGADWTVWGLRHLGHAFAGLTSGAIQYLVEENHRRQNALEDEEPGLDITYFEGLGEGIHNSSSRAPVRSYLGLEDLQPEPEQASSSTSRQASTVFKNHLNEETNFRPMASPFRARGRVRQG